MAGHAAPLPSVITKKAARSNTGNQLSRCRAAPDMITHQRQLPCRTPRGTGPPEGPVTSRLEPRTPLALPNHNEDMSAHADRAGVAPRGPNETHLRHPTSK